MKRLYCHLVSIFIVLVKVFHHLSKQAEEEDDEIVTGSLSKAYPFLIFFA
jgi:hypothetical protein